MSYLSIFVDESGDFGDYQPHSPYYIASMVLHDQAQSMAYKKRDDKGLTKIGDCGARLMERNYFLFLDLPFGLISRNRSDLNPVYDPDQQGGENEVEHRNGD